MAFICYVYEVREQVPYMEVLAVNSLAEARSRARDLLLERPHCRVAELWDEDQLIGSYDRAEFVSAN